MKVIWEDTKRFVNVLNFVVLDNFQDKIFVYTVLCIFIFCFFHGLCSGHSDKYSK